MSSYLDKQGLERVWSKATDKFATIATTDALQGNIKNLTDTKADKTEVQTAVANLVDSAPDTLNTLNELAAALGDDPNFATTIATEIGKKVNSNDYNDTIASINTNIASITPEKIGALNEENYLGPVVLKGNPVVYEKGIEGLGIAATTYLEPVQAGSGDPSPSNIRPISGYNAMKLVRTGKNLFSGSSNKLVSNGITLEKDRGSEVTVYGSAAITLGMRVFETQLPAGTYTFSIGEIGNVNRFEPCIDGTPIAQLRSGDTWTLTLEAAAAVGLNMIVSKDADCGTEDNPTRIKVQLEIGADVTAYEPYQGSTYSIDFGQTIYGGSFDWQTGKLTADKAYYVIDGVNIKCNAVYGVDAVKIPCVDNVFPSTKDDLPMWCDTLKPVYSYNDVRDNNNTIRIVTGKVALHINNMQGVGEGKPYPTMTALVNEANTWLQTHPVGVCYTLTEPITIQLTPTQISELSGLNTLYGDGSNIHAIFNTTSGAVSTLETIPGILPIEKGGTGAISAATARTALGITPANIGALPIGGGNVTGRIEINGGENYVDLSVVRKINNSNHTVCILPNSTTGAAQFTYIKDGTIKNHLMLNENHTAFMQPVNIASGGTGATDAATARSNLGVPSTTGSGASGNWGINITGSSASCTGNAASASAVAWGGVSGKPSYYDAKAIKGITRSGTTFTYTCMDGTTGTFTQQDNNTTYSAATTSANGLMTAAMVTKLNGIAEGANKYTYTLPNASSSTLGGVKVGSNITVSSGTISLTKTNVTTALGYTPLSTTGGTLTSSSDTPLTIKSGTTTSFIGFQNSSGTNLGYFGYSAANTPVVYFSGSSKTLYHSGNLKYGALSSRPSTGSNGDIYLATS